ncbi:MAG: hypothetical protein QNJ19_16900 [Woeseiaceae bacterium]|nr:hypothetical protein [Woeseiaceae bacterium]
MKLSLREQKLLADARSDLKSWKYTRWVWLIAAFAAFGVAIDLLFSDSVFGMEPVLVLQVILSGLGLQGIIWTVLNWDNERTRLLVRLVDNPDEQGRL